MKRITAIILALSLTFLAGCKDKPADTTSKNSSIETTTALSEEVKQDANGEMITNGTFDSGETKGWSTFSQGGSGTISVVDKKLVVDVTDAGNLDYAFQVYQDGFKLDTGCKYEMKFDISSTVERALEFRIQINGGDYHAYISKVVTASTKEQTCIVDFDMTESSDPAPRLAFNMGLPKGTDSIAPHKITFDNISLKVIDDSNKIVAPKAKQLPNINIDQLGYRPDYKKVAVFRGENVDKTFDVVNADTNKVVFTGDITNKTENETAGETDYYGDFSSVTDEGTYIIKTKNSGESYKFKISKDVYNNAFNDVVKMLYLQRCGSELPQNFAGDFTHPACHNTKATIFGTQTKIDVTGGWHDAGDYGRYVVPGAKTVADIISAYDANPSAFSDNTGIPESGNKVPDILDEARYELEWFLKMQDSASGGVYHKVTCANFPGNVMPEKETDELIVSPMSTTATADFAATMALSYETFKSYDAKFANQCLAAAEKAWAWLGANFPGGFANPEGVVTGEYGDGRYTDEIFWAAAELYKVTGKAVYNDYIVKEYSPMVPAGFGWADVGYYGMAAYLSIPADKVDSATYTTFKNALIQKADTIVSDSKKDGYLISLGKNYPWGSNMTVANNAMHLLLANKIQPNAEYVEVAREHLHYCFGKNPMSISYVTGYGTASPISTHHRPSAALAKTMPGMLVGGPNKNLEDPYAKAVLTDSPPAKCYVDNIQSFSCNEITIYWNSPLIYLMSNVG